MASGNGSNDTKVDMEAMYGVRVDMTGGKPVYSIYAHTKAVQDKAEVFLYEVKDKEPIQVKSLGTASLDEQKGFL